MLLELPGGFVDDGEAVLDAARRELREETGYHAGRMDVVGRTWLAASSEREQYCVLAFDCTPAVRRGATGWSSRRSWLSAPTASSRWSARAT